jgi:hypothetical protein
MKLEQACRWRPEGGYRIVASSKDFVDTGKIEVFSDVMNPLFADKDNPNSFIQGYSVITFAIKDNVVLLGRSTMWSDTGSRPTMFSNVYTCSLQEYEKLINKNFEAFLTIDYTNMADRYESNNLELESFELDENAKYSSDIDLLRQKYNLDNESYATLIMYAVQVLSGSYSLTIETKDTDDYVKIDKVRDFAYCISSGIISSMLKYLTYSSSADYRQKLNISSVGDKIPTSVLRFSEYSENRKFIKKDDIKYPVFLELASMNETERKKTLKDMQRWIDDNVSKKVKPTLGLFVTSFYLSSNRKLSLDKALFIILEFIKAGDNDMNDIEVLKSQTLKSLKGLEEDLNQNSSLDYNEYYPILDWCIENSCDDNKEFCFTILNSSDENEQKSIINKILSKNLEKEFSEIDIYLVEQVMKSFLYRKEKLFVKEFLEGLFNHYNDALRTKNNEDDDRAKDFIDYMINIEMPDMELDEKIAFLKKIDEKYMYLADEILLTIKKDESLKDLYITYKVEKELSGELTLNELIEKIELNPIKDNNSYFEKKLKELIIEKFESYNFNDRLKDIFDIFNDFKKIDIKLESYKDNISEENLVILRTSLYDVFWEKASFKEVVELSFKKELEEVLSDWQPSSNVACVKSDFYNLCINSYSNTKKVSKLVAFILNDISSKNQSEIVGSCLKDIIKHLQEMKYSSIDLILLKNSEINKKGKREYLAESCVKHISILHTNNIELSVSDSIILQEETALRKELISILKKKVKENEGMNEILEEIKDIDNSEKDEKTPVIKDFFGKLFGKKDE